MPSQLALPLASSASMGRADFIVAPGNARAAAFVDSWPGWPVSAAAIYGPSGSGKTHLVAIWCAQSGARRTSAANLAEAGEGPLAVEDVDACPPSEARDKRLFTALERASADRPLLLTGREPPQAWPVQLPDLASRFAALLSFPLWKPDDALLESLARKLLADRQLQVSAAVIDRILQNVERSPAAIRDFIAKADAKALSESRPVTLSLVRELIANEDDRLS